MTGFAYKDYDKNGNYIWIIDDVDMDDLLALDPDNTIIPVNYLFSVVSDKALMTATEGLYDVIKDFILGTTGIKITTNEARFIDKSKGFDKDLRDIDLCYFIVTPSTGL